MKIYFYTNQELNNTDAKEIINHLRRADIEVISSLSSSSDTQLERVDAFVFQGQKFDTKAGYLTALALAQSKEVLCLLPSGSKIDSSLASLRDNRNLAKHLLVEFYTDSDLSDKLEKFLTKLDKKTIRDLFNIKYTLRVSGKINDYLNWKAREKSVKKADWIRDNIQDLMKNDEKYQDFLKNKFKAG
ncbi:hypothetical protein KKH39_02900 [Patescibacteria group bacterium]|nr:hypothetical protein [Patescibacteria group bacterium]